MKNSLIFVFLVTACSSNIKKEKEPFPILTVTDNEWATYEGRWISGKGVIEFELSLKEGTIGVDSYYKLSESVLSDSVAYGTVSQNTYSTTAGFANNELGIRLHNLEKYSLSTALRFKESSSDEVAEEMFFITRGNEELIPCDNHFKPITQDKRYTLHKRSKLFTVEGYFTFEQDSSEFFERNTRENWKVANLGEFYKLKLEYDKIAKEAYEGIYLKALAYSVSDSIQRRKTNAIVIKRILHTERGKGLGLD